MTDDLIFSLASEHGLTPKEARTMFRKGVRGQRLHELTASTGIPLATIFGWILQFGPQTIELIEAVKEALSKRGPQSALASSQPRPETTSESGAEEAE